MPPHGAGAFVFGFQRILFFQSLRRVLPVTIFELPLEMRILDLQLGNRPLQSPHEMIAFNASPSVMLDGVSESVPD